MKKSFSTFLLIFLCIGSLMAQPSDRPLLRIQLNDNSPISVSVDGRYYKKHAAALVIGDLPKGKHHIKVYAYYRNRRGYDNQSDLIFEGTVRTARGTITNCVIDANTGNMQQTSRELTDNDFSQAPAHSDRDYSNQGSDNIYSQGAEPTPPPAAAEDNKYSGGTADNGLSAKEMDALHVKVNAKITDGDKLKVLEKSLKSRSYYTDQLGTIMSWVNFESTRLDFAKWAYEHTIDKKNFYKLEKQFTFNSSKEELESYINSAK